MVNPWRGEVKLVLDGRPQIMKLTLGALAELETTLQCGSLVDLVKRFETGDFTGRDVLALTVAGLRGGGWTGQGENLLTSEIEGGLIAASQAAAQLLVVAFAPAEPVS